jgi:preprotein translocase subunit YajC
MAAPLARVLPRCRRSPGVIPSGLYLFAPAAGQTDGRAMGAFAVQMLLIVGIVYFLLIRPKMQQEKKHRDRLGQLKTKDEVLTVGGIIGEVIHIKDDRITIKSGESRLVIQRDRVAEIRSGGSTESTAAP